MNISKATIKNKLLKRKAELEIELEMLSQQRNPDATSSDPTDQAASASLEELAISLEKQQHQEYNRIIKALEMFDGGTYGICIDCEGPIEERRLEAYPNATRCLKCQRIQEEGC